MTYLVSVSSRGLIYFPREVLKKMGVKMPGRLVLSMDKKKACLEPVGDFFALAGTIKKKAPENFDFRKYVEENYNEVDRY